MTRPLRVLIADDELLARRRLTRLLGALPDVELVAICKSGEEVLTEITQREADPQSPSLDLLLLDIQMPGLTGIDVSELLPTDTGGNVPVVVFVTAHPEHALDAFRVGARDYLLKPIDLERLRRMIDRIRGRHDTPDPTTNSDFRARLAIAGPRGVRLIRSETISHAIFDGTAVIIHTGERRLFSNGSLSDLERRLDPERFVRVHRRALINLDFVELLEPTETGGFIARLMSGDRVEVSRQAARRLRRRLGL